MCRISREQLNMETALLTSQRSSCLKMRVGIVAVSDNRIIASGYNGVLPGFEPTSGLDDDGNTRTVHAEANLVSYCARKGIALEGSTIYVTLSPCRKCAELLIQAGVERVIYFDEYRDTDGLELLTDCTVVVDKYEGKVNQDYEIAIKNS